jgi:hypothetical protein
LILIKQKKGAHGPLFQQHDPSVQRAGETDWACPTLCPLIQAAVHPPATSRISKAASEKRRTIILLGPARSEAGFFVTRPGTGLVVLIAIMASHVYQFYMTHFGQFVIPYFRLCDRLLQIAVN